MMHAASVYKKSQNDRKIVTYQNNGSVTPFLGIYGLITTLKAGG